jgi:hypothetical protein
MIAIVIDVQSALICLFPSWWMCSSVAHAHPLEAFANRWVYRFEAIDFRATLIDVRRDTTIRSITSRS